MRVKGSILADNVGLQSGITFTDGTNTYSSKNELNLNDTDFYLTADASGNPVLNLDQPFEGSLVRMDTNNTLTTGVAESLTFSEEVYDITKDGTGWFDAVSSATNFVIPMGVNFVVCFVRTVLTITGTPATISEFFGSFATITILKNGLGVPTGGTVTRSILNSSAVAMYISTAPLPVTKGDIITFTINATFPGAGITAVSVTAANTYGGVYKIG